MDKQPGKRPGSPHKGAKSAIASHGGPGLVRPRTRFQASQFIRFLLRNESTHLSSADRSRLASTIRIAVVPELVQRHENDLPVFGQGDVVEIDLDGLVALLLDRDNNSFRQFQKEMDLLREAPAHVFDQFVRLVIDRIGGMWNEDTAGFYEVTLAAARLQTLVHEKIQQASTRVSRERQARRILLARVSEDEHTLGLLVVTACFQEAGWEVIGGTDLACGPGMFRELAQSSYSVLGLSVGVAIEAERLNKIIAKARSVSAKSGLGICVGGPAFTADRERLARVAADFVATDALSAVRNAEARLG
jgi:methanogenic corrinoid protein MtbC1